MPPRVGASPRWTIDVPLKIERNRPHRWFGLKVRSCCQRTDLRTIGPLQVKFHVVWTPVERFSHREVLLNICAWFQSRFVQQRTSRTVPTLVENLKKMFFWTKKRIDKKNRPSSGCFLSLHYKLTTCIGYKVILKQLLTLQADPEPCLAKRTGVQWLLLQPWASRTTSFWPPCAQQLV